MAFPKAQPITHQCVVPMARGQRLFGGQRADDGSR